MSKMTTGRGAHGLMHGWHLFRNRKTLWHMMRAVVSGGYRMSLLTTLVVIISIAYILFPFDLVPDYIPILGWIDDAVVFYLMVKILMKETRRFNRYKAMKRKPMAADHSME